MEVEVNPSPQLPQLSCEYTHLAVIRGSLSQWDAPDSLTQTYRRTHPI